MTGRGCYCSGWWGITQPPPCPVHRPDAVEPFRLVTVLPSAWECPRCQTINAPHVESCSCRPAALPAGVTITVNDIKVLT